VYMKPTAPRSVGGVVDDAIRLYRGAFAKSWPLALCAELLIAVPLLVIQLRMRGAPPGNSQAMLAAMSSPTIWLSYLIMTVITFGFYNALVVQADAFAAARAAPFGRSLATGFRLLPRMVLLVILIFAALGLAAAIAAILFTLLRVPGAPFVRLAVGVAIALIALYAWGRAFLANIALVVEDAGVFKSLGISWTLIKDHWWRTASIYTMAIILALVFYLVLGFLSGFVIVMLHDSFGPATALNQLISIVAGTLLMPFYPAVLLAIYYDLKLRKEGTDLAGRVDALSSR